MGDDLDTPIETERAGRDRPARKVHTPRVPKHAVARGRLTDRLVAARPRLAILVAPPGYGKTTLLAEWAAADPRPVAWVSVDSSDNDPAVLWASIAAAVAATGAIANGARAAGIALDPDPARALAQRLATRGRDVVLVLDDYFHIDSDEVHDAIGRLVELAPPTFQLVIASRTEPPLPVARLRAQGELVEIRARDLRFTRAEAVDFVRRTGDVDLEDGAADTLFQRTEGWPAGMYLACLSLRGAVDQEAFVASFGASNRHVLDYLTEQVLTTLEPDVLRFLLWTSVVDEVSGSLADALLSTSGSGDRLRALERANTFITPLDDRREWYRYHHLFRELLRLELARRSPDRVPGLHLRASAWFAAAGELDPAVRHAIAAGDLDGAARLVTGRYLASIEVGRFATIVGWLDALGPGVVAANRGLAVVQAWTLHFLGRHAEADAALATAMRAPDDAPLPDGASSIESTAALINAAFPLGDAGKMLAAAERAYELETSSESPWRATVHILLGFGLVRVGRWAEARQPLEEGGELANRLGLWMDATGARTLLAQVALHTGDEGRAEALAREATALADAHGLGPTTTGEYARATLGEVLIARGEAAAGTALIEDALPMLRRLGEPLSVAQFLIPLAGGYQQRGRRDASLAALREARELVASMPDPGVLRQLLDRAAEDRGHIRHAGQELSEREVEVLRMLALGLSNREAGARLFVSYNTIHSHVRSIYRKLDVRSRADAVSRARALGLFD